MTHIDFVRDGLVVTNATARAHLDACATCRGRLDALLRAERLLADPPSPIAAPERDAILAHVLSSVAAREVPRARTIAPRRALRRLAPLAPVAMAASLLWWWRSPTDDTFAARSTASVDAPLTVFCVHDANVHPASAAMPCQTGDAVVVSAQLLQAATIHVFGRGLVAFTDEAGHTLAANEQRVLTDDWTRNGNAAPQLTVVACSEGCDRTTAETRIHSDVNVWVIDVPWATP